MDEWIQADINRRGAGVVLDEQDDDVLDELPPSEIQNLLTQGLARPADPDQGEPTGGYFIGGNWWLLDATRAVFVRQDE
jgi:hypothetical protein